MFARLQEFRCTHCDKKFIGAEINHCSYHMGQPKFLFNEVVGTYPCCNSKAHRFQTLNQQNHCSSQNHRIKIGSPRKTVANRAKNFDLLMEHFKVACEPFYFMKENLLTGEMEQKMLYSDMIDEEKSLINLVKAYIK